MADEDPFAAMEAMLDGGGDADLDLGDDSAADAGADPDMDDLFGDLENMLDAGLGVRGTRGAERPPWPADSLGFRPNSR